MPSSSVLNFWKFRTEGWGVREVPKAAIMLGKSAEIYFFGYSPTEKPIIDGQKTTALDAIPQNLIGNTVEGSRKN